MRNRTALALLVPICFSGLVLSAIQACSGSDSQFSGNTGGDAGAATGGNGTGGSATGGSATGGSPTGGMGGGDGTDASCEEDEWTHPDTGACEVCPGAMGGAPNEITCEDLLYDGTNTSWDPETKTLTLQHQAGGPNIVAATVAFQYCTADNDCLPVTAAMSIDGYTMQATFDQIAAPSSYSLDMVLTAQDACGNEVEISNFWWQGDESEYEYYCE